MFRVRVSNKHEREVRVASLLHFISQGTITELEVDAIVNAANRTLLGIAYILVYF